MTRWYWPRWPRAGCGGQVPDLAQALDGQFDAHHARMAKTILTRLDMVKWTSPTCCAPGARSRNWWPPSRPSSTRSAPPPRSPASRRPAENVIGLAVSVPPRVKRRQVRDIFQNRDAPGPPAAGEHCSGSGSPLPRSPSPSTRYRRLPHLEVEYRRSGIGSAAVEVNPEDALEAAPLPVVRVLAEPKPRRGTVGMR